MLSCMLLHIRKTIIPINFAMHMICYFHRCIHQMINDTITDLDIQNVHLCLRAHTMAYHQLTLIRCLSSLFREKKCLIQNDFITTLMLW